MKKKVGNFYGKPVITGDVNELTSNEILVDTNAEGKITNLTQRVNGSLEQLLDISNEGGGSSGDNGDNTLNYPIDVIINYTFSTGYWGVSEDYLQQMENFYYSVWYTPLGFYDSYQQKYFDYIDLLRGDSSGTVVFKITPVKITKELLDWYKNLCDIEIDESQKIVKYINENTGEFRFALNQGYPDIRLYYPKANTLYKVKE